MHSISVPRNLYDEMDRIRDAFMEWGDAAGALVSIDPDHVDIDKFRNSEAEAYEKLYLLYRELRGK